MAAAPAQTKEDNSRGNYTVGGAAGIGAGRSNYRAVRMLGFRDLIIADKNLLSEDAPRWLLLMIAKLD